MTKQILKNQKVYGWNSKQVFHSDVVLDPGCSQFGKLTAKPGQKTIRVMFDFSRDLWIRTEI